MKAILFYLVLGLLFTAGLGTNVYGIQIQPSGHAELVSASPVSSANASNSASDVKIAFEQNSPDTPTSGGFISNNWAALAIGLLGFFDVVARLTPTEKDNSIVNLLTTIINAIIPNFRKGGGRF